MRRDALWGLIPASNYEGKRVNRRQLDRGASQVILRHGKESREHNKRLKLLRGGLPREFNSKLDIGNRRAVACQIYTQPHELDPTPSFLRQT